MCEILFRGKRMDDGEWVEGYLVKAVGGECMILPVTTEHCGGAEFSEGYHCDPTTVGQYTGLKDKHGKRIFEGDILRWTGEDGETGKVIVIFAGGLFLLKCVEVLDAPADPFYEFDRGGQTLEVIGNIHDNPELLEGGDEG